MLVEYKTVAKEAEITMIERKSKFIGRIKPVQTVEEAEEFIEAIRKQHWDATHNVPAYILGTNREIQKFSDANEPSGTAGLPMLEMLKGHDVVNVAAVVTRYYGGIQLGRGGLIRAYGGATRQALQAAGVVRMVPAQKVAITVDYVHVGKIENELLSAGIFIADTEYLENVTFHVQLLTSEIETTRQLLQELTANEFAWAESGGLYRPLPVEE